jgi:hypothetical protein
MLTGIIGQATQPSTGGLGTGDWIQIGVLFVTAVIGIWQIRIGVNSVREDHDRRRKQATIEYINDVRDRYRAEHRHLLRALGGPMNAQSVEKIRSNPDLNARLLDLLGLFEGLAAGVNAGVFDVELLNRVSGGYLIRVFETYKAYMLARRQSRWPSLYREFEQLVQDLRKLRPELSDVEPHALAEQSGTTAA